MRSTARQLATLMLAFSVSLALFTQTACGAPEVKRVGERAAALASLAVSFDPAGQLLAERLISPDEAEVVRSKVSAWASIARAFHAEVAAALGANPKASLIELAPQFAALLTRWNELQAIKFSNAKAQLLFDRALSVARVTVTAISAFYAARLLVARRALEGEGAVEARYFAAAGISYDPERLARARASYRRGGLACGVNDYLGTRLGDGEVRLLLGAGGRA
jgi:hypothetical protein